MSENVIPLFTKRKFDFSNLGSGKSVEAILVRELDVSGYGDAQLAVRVHAVNLGEGTSVRVVARAASPSPEEPETMFVRSTPLGEITFDDTTTAPDYIVQRLSPQSGSHVQIAVIATQDADLRTVEVTMSAELILNAVRGPVTGQISGGKQALKTPTGTTETIDWNDGNFADIDLELATGDVTLTFDNPVAGARYVMLVRQDSTTARNIVWPASVQWPGSGAPTISASGNAQDMFHLDYDGAVYHAVRVPRHTEYILSSFVLSTGDSAVEKFIPFNSTVESTTVGYWNQILMPRDGMLVSATFRADKALNASADVEVHRASNGSATFSEIDSDLTVNMATANTATVADLFTPFNRHDVIAVNFQTTVTATTNVVCMLEVEFYD